MRRSCFSVLVAFCGVSAHAQVVAGYEVQVYAKVTDPVRMAFANSGDLVCGRDASGTPGGTNSTPTKVHRIPSGGQIAIEQGTTALADPDAVTIDRNGLFSPNSIIVGGANSTTTGYISLIRPDQVILTVSATGTLTVNPSDFDWTSNNKLLIADANRNMVMRLDTLGFASLVTWTGVSSIDVDTDGNLFVGNSSATIRIYSSTGAAINTNFYTFPTASSPVSFSLSPGGGEFPHKLYAANNGTLYGVSASGVGLVIGSGFSTVIQDLIFGPDGAMYMADFPNDRVLRVAKLSPTTVSGTLVLEDFNAEIGDYPSEVTVEIRQAATDVVRSSQVINPNVSGTFSFELPATGAYEVTARAGTWLRKTILADARFGSLDNVQLRLLNGDCDRSNSIGTDDYLILNDAFDTTLGDALFDTRADLDGDNTVGTDDYIILNKNFDRDGDD